MDVSGSQHSISPDARNEFNRIVRLHQSGDTAAAEKAYRDFLAHEPEYAPCLHMLGVICLQGGDFAGAIEWIGKAIALDSLQAVYFNNFGAALHRLERRIEALAAFHRAVEIRPSYVDALSNLGMIYDELGQYTKAVSLFRQALELAPDNTEVKLRYGKVAERRGETAELIRLCDDLLRNQPTAELHVRMGNHLVSCGKSQDAEVHYKQALELEPQNVAAMFNLANALQEQHKVAEATTVFRRAAANRPKQPYWRLRAEATCPVLWDNVSQIDDYCESLSNELDRWIVDPPLSRPQDLMNAGAFPNFSFAYLGRNVVGLKRKFAEVYRRHFRDHKRPEPVRGKERIRIGFVVTHRHEGIFLRCLAGILQNLSRQRFEPVVFCASAGLSRLQLGLSAGDCSFVTIPPFVEAAAGIIREKRCDILYHWEAGSDSLNYFLPFYRLAPVQCTSHGSQITSGNPEIDYFYSSSLMELDTAQNHYAEKLWNSSTLLMNQPRLHPPPVRSRAEFGLPAGRTLYTSLQNPLKLHPDFNRIIAEVLRQDRTGVVVLLRGGAEYVEELIRSHFARFHSDIADRVIVLPHQPFPDYLNLIRMADVLLDPLYFGWGSSCYDCFSFNQPLVTLPTELNVGRVAKAFNERVGVGELVANSAEEYVETAVRLGRSSDLRHEFNERIAAGSATLFDDRLAVADHERFFEMLYAREVS